MGCCQFESCKRKLSLAVAFYATCKCKKQLCEIHRPAEMHKCSFNYFQENQKNMMNNLSSIVFTKKELNLREVI